ncbi:unnamed protein product [Cochlearia groenlandica]
MTMDLAWCRSGIIMGDDRRRSGRIMGEDQRRAGWILRFAGVMLEVQTRTGIQGICGSGLGEESKGVGEVIQIDIWHNFCRFSTTQRGIHVRDFCFLKWDSDIQNISLIFVSLVDIFRWWSLKEIPINFVMDMAIGMIQGIKSRDVLMNEVNWRAKIKELSVSLQYLRTRRVRIGNVHTIIVLCTWPFLISVLTSLMATNGVSAMVADECTHNGGKGVECGSPSG